MADKEASGSSDTNPIIIALVVCVILFVGGSAIITFILPTRIAQAWTVQQEKMELLAPKDTSADAESEDDTKSEGGAKKEGGGEGKEGAAKTIEEFTVNNLLLNIAGSSGRFIKVSLTFDANKKTLGELEAHRPKIVDIVSQIISSKTLPELSASDVRSKLRTELIATINPDLKSKEGLRNIYFQEFNLQ